MRYFVVCFREFQNLLKINKTKKLKIKNCKELLLCLTYSSSKRHLVTETTSKKKEDFFW